MSRRIYLPIVMSLLILQGVGCGGGSGNESPSYVGDAEDPDCADNNTGELLYTNSSTAPMKVIINGLNYGYISPGETLRANLDAGFQATVSSKWQDGTEACPTATTPIVVCQSRSIACSAKPMPADDITPPSAPANLTATPASPTQINLVWTAATDAVGVTEYKVYRDGIYLKATTTTSTTDTDLAESTQYCYQVVAYDAVGNGSVESTQACATTTQPASSSTKWTGTKQFGVSGQGTTASDVVVDSSGNVYVAGTTSGGLDGNTLTGTKDFFVTQYDSSGNKIRTKQLGVSGEDTYAAGVAVDSSGNVYVAGYTYGGLDGNILTGTRDFFVTTYDSSGNKIRTKQLGFSGKDTYASDIAVDSSGNVYVAGSTNGVLDGITHPVNYSFFFTKYDSSGNMIRTKQLAAGGGGVYAYGIAVDSSDNVYVAGYTYGGLDGNTLMGIVDFFVTTYDSLGNKVRTKQHGVLGEKTYAKGVAVDSSSNVYVVGNTSGGLDGNTLTGSRDFFVSKYDSSGNKVRTKQLGVSGKGTYAEGVRVDSSGNVYVAGTTFGGLDGNTLAGISDCFVTKYDSLGNKVRTRQLGVSGKTTWAWGVAVDSSGNVYVDGSTTGGLDGNTLSGTNDFFVTKYDSSGNKQ